MTPEQQAQRARILAARAELKAALAAHTHVHSEAGCAVCDDGHGWACPEAPDGWCHYNPVRGSTTTVLLRDGTTVELPEPVEEQHEDCGICLFCGEPDERK